MPKLTMNINEAAKALRDAGIPITAARLADGIEQGYYPVGRMVSKDPNTGRRAFEIFRVDLMAFVDSKTPKGM